MRPRFKKIILIAPFAILAMVLFVFLGGMIVMLLWNWLLPPLFGFHQLQFWQALGLLLLARILVGGLGCRGMTRSKMRHRMEERFDWMTPEEREQLRERFRQRMRERWGFGPAATESKGQ